MLNRTHFVVALPLLSSLLAGCHSCGDAPAADAAPEQAAPTEPAEERVDGGRARLNRLRLSPRLLDGSARHHHADAALEP